MLIHCQHYPYAETLIYTLHNAKPSIRVIMTDTFKWFSHFLYIYICYDNLLQEKTSQLLSVLSH